MELAVFWLLVVMVYVAGTTYAQANGNNMPLVIGSLALTLALLYWLLAGAHTPIRAVLALAAVVAVAFLQYLACILFLDGRPRPPDAPESPKQKH